MPIRLFRCNERVPTRAHGRQRDEPRAATPPHVREGDVIELTLRGERRTAEVMIISEDDQVLLDLFDGDRPAFARLSSLVDVTVFRPDAAELSFAA